MSTLREIAEELVARFEDWHYSHGEYCGNAAGDETKIADDVIANTRAMSDAEIRDYVNSDETGGCVHNLDSTDFAVIRACDDTLQSLIREICADSEYVISGIEDYRAKDGRLYTGWLAQQMRIADEQSS